MITSNPLAFYTSEIKKRRKLCIHLILCDVICCKAINKEAGRAIKGAEVISGITDVAHACVGFIDALDLCYPNKLKKIFLEQEGGRKKVNLLKVSLKDTQMSLKSDRSKELHVKPVTF